MASKVTICNKALRRIGEGRVNNLDSPYNSVTEQDVSEIYDEALREVLSCGAFRFAVKTAPLGRLEAEPERHACVFGLPGDCIKPLYLHNPIGPNTPIPFELTSAGLEADEQQAHLVYVKLVEDPNSFDPLFISVLAWRVAAEFATSIGKPDMAAAAWQGYAAEMRVAQGVSAGASRKPSTVGRGTLNARNA